MPRDPRYRPFRLALWVTYLGVLSFALAVLISSVVRHLRGPHRPPPSAELPTRAALRVCASELEGLQREQSARAWRFADEIGEGDAVARWETWSRDWEQRVGDLSDRCRLDAGGGELRAGREALARARDAVLALHRAYRAQVNRFAQEDAELAASAARALGVARDEIQREQERR